jgi:hypothetical protein
VIDALGSRLNFMIFRSWLWNLDPSEFIHHFKCDPILRGLSDHQNKKLKKSQFQKKLVMGCMVNVCIHITTKMPINFRVHKSQ